MRHIFLALLLVYFVTADDSSGPDKAKYTTKYDGVDLQEILASERLLTGYVKCLLDQGPCTPDGKELKRNLPDAIDNDCAKCTRRQREGADQVMHYIIDHRPDDWDKLEAKYLIDYNQPDDRVRVREFTARRPLTFWRFRGNERHALYQSDGSYKQKYLDSKKANSTTTKPVEEN